MKTGKLTFADYLRLGGFALFILLLWFSLYCISNKALQGQGGKWPAGLDMATLLEGTASIALIIISIVAGILAVLGWRSLEERIVESVEKATTARLETLENELRGRAAAVMGYLIGESSLKDNALEVANKVRLQEALNYCETAYNMLKKVGGPAEFLPLNNLVFYHCLLGTPTRSEYLLESARKLRKRGEEHDAPNLQLTYCRAILQLGGSETEYRDVRALISALGNHPRLTEKEKREAEFLASLCAAGRPLQPI
jgi:hypothetical protein